MTDYIERQEAIDAVYYAIGDGDKADFCADVIRSVPSADVVPVRHGRWKQAMLDHEAFGERPFIYYCSKCCQCAVSKTSYCPNCGARMDGDENADEITV